MTILEHSFKTPSHVTTSLPMFYWNCNSKIVNVIDVIAPAKIKVISGKQPWRNVASVTAQKRECVKKL